MYGDAPAPNAAAGGPGRAAVGGGIDARPCCGVETRGVGRIDDEAIEAHAHKRGTGNQRPGRTAVDRTEDPLSEVGEGVALARAHVHSRGRPRVETECTNRQRRQPVAARSPRGACVATLPDTSTA